MGGGEIVLILAVIVMLFGAEKIPEIARELGKIIKQIRNATEEIKNEIKQSADQIGIDDSVTKDIKEEINKVKETVDETITGPIKRNY